MAAKRMIVVHHSEATWSNFDNIYHTHTDPTKQGGNGWSHIGYHMIIEKTGQVHRGLWDLESGYHTLDVCNIKKAVGGILNSISLGVCVCGQFNQYHITRAQWESLIEVVALWCVRHNIVPNRDRIKGHLDLQHIKRIELLDTDILNFKKIHHPQIEDVEHHPNSKDNTKNKTVILYKNTCPGNLLYPKLNDLCSKVDEKIKVEKEALKRKANGTCPASEYQPWY